MSGYWSTNYLSLAKQTTFDLSGYMYQSQAQITDLRNAWNTYERIQICNIQVSTNIGSGTLLYGAGINSPYFYQFASMEEKHGSLIRGMFSAPKSTSKSPFVSFKNGMQTLVSALEKKLQGSIKRNTKVESIIPSEDGLYQLNFSNGQSKYARAVLVTTPAIPCANLLGIISPEASAQLRNLRVSASGSIYFAFRKLDIDHPLQGFGFVVPVSERRAINAITWVSSKLENRVPAGAVLFRVFFGGHKNPGIMSKSDIEIDNIALQELKQIMKIPVAPLFSKIYRNNHDNPQYEVGHLQHMEKIMALLPEGIEIAGSAYGGVGIPDCVHQGRSKAQKAIACVLKKSSGPL